jgi:hypothetical protein
MSAHTHFLCLSVSLFPSLFIYLFISLPCLLVGYFWQPGLDCVLLVVLPRHLRMAQSAAQ